MDRSAASRLEIGDFDRVTKTLGILTSGGDCPGLNAAIRAAAHAAVNVRGWRMVGIEHGTKGLLERPVGARPLTPDAFNGGLLRQAGTVLGATNKGDPFAYPMPDGSTMDRSEEMLEGLKSLQLDALIGIGGDGSLTILRRLAQQGGINLIGVPKTIDNDVGLTEVSIGFDTAMRVATEALDSLQPTAASHDRVMILEVMGRDAGHIALASGIAGGADIILIPEVDYSMDAVTGAIDRIRQRGRNFALAVVAEGVRTEDGARVTTIQPGGKITYGGIGNHLADLIARRTGAETRVTVLGHLQRGAPPSPRDRLIASAFGAHAVELACDGLFDRMVAWQQRRVVDVPLGDAIATSGGVREDSELVQTARSLGISLGES